MGPPLDDPRKLLYAAARWMTAAGWTYATVGFLLVFPGLGEWHLAVAAGVQARGVGRTEAGGFAGFIKCPGPQ